MADAQTWVGAGAEGDSLDADKIAATLPPDAAALHTILRDERVAGLIKIRREASKAATAAQDSFRRYSVVAILGTTLSTFASGLLLYDAGSGNRPSIAIEQPEAPQRPDSQPSAADPAVAEQPPVPPADVPRLVEWVHKFRIPIIVVQIVGLFLAAMATSVLAAQNYSGTWRDARRKAERLRREVFLEIAKLAAAMVPAPLDPPDPKNPVAQSLELFRRYQHEVQLRYYGKGVERHGRAATLLVFVVATLAGIAAITGAIAAIGPTALVVSAFLGIAVPILLAAAQSWRVTGGDSDKATAYAKAKEELDNIMLTLGEVRRKAGLGDAAAVRGYMDSVHLVMTAENEAWAPSARGE
jgi:hypothetical protein